MPSKNEAVKIEWNERQRKRKKKQMKVNRNLLSTLKKQDRIN